MKKSAVIVVAVVLALTLTCLVACGSDQTFDEINEALHSEYSTVTVTVSTERDGIKLGGVFKVIFSGESATVEYYYDKLSELSVNGGNPDSCITTMSGVAKVENGILSEDSLTEDLNVGQLDYTGFNFKKSFLSDVQNNENEFVANVSNPQGFVGNNQFECSNMIVRVAFAEKLINSLRLSFVSKAGAQVQVTYIFSV